MNMKRLLFVFTFLLTCIVSWADILGPFPVSETNTDDYPGYARMVVTGQTDARVCIQSVENPSEVYIICQGLITDSLGRSVPTAYFFEPGSYKVIMKDCSTFWYMAHELNEGDVFTVVSTGYLSMS